MLEKWRIFVNTVTESKMLTKSKMMKAINIWPVLKLKIFPNLLTICDKLLTLLGISYSLAENMYYE